VEQAAKRLHDLRVRTVEGGALAAASFAGAVAAGRLYPALAVPLLVGGAATAFLGMRALVCRHLLIEDLAADRDAFLIREVHRFALRAASAENRRLVADSLRGVLDSSAGDVRRVEANRARLQELVAALLDERLALDAHSAAALDRLRTEGWRPLYSPAVSSEEARSRLQQILNGFHVARDSSTLLQKEEGELWRNTD
jgi:HPt (histidine-containing phosphotransfer) domain-containing protein